jgi:hypothetical protein
MESTALVGHGWDVSGGEDGVTLVVLQANHSCTDAARLSRFRSCIGSRQPFAGVVGSASAANPLGDGRVVRAAGLYKFHDCSALIA